MKGDFRDKLRKITTAAFSGLIGATAMIHITLLFIPIFRDFENRYLTEQHSELETATLLIVGFLTLIMEPVTYIVNLAVSLEKHGLIAFLWLAPLGITQSYSCIRWVMQKNLDQ